MKWSFHVLVLGALVLQAAAQTNVVSNGGFEEPWANNDAPGWDSVSGYAEHQVTTSAAEGQCYLAVIGNVYQDIQTIPGKVYRLRYALAGDPYPQGPVSLQVSWAGSPVATATFNTTGHSNESLGWVYVTNFIRANTTTTRLWFANGTPGTPYLDNVSAVAVDAQPTTCLPPPSGIVGWWPGQTNGLDVVGTNRGVLLNGASFGAGEVGQGFLLAGSNPCVRLAYSPSLAASNYTIEAWVEPLAQPADPSKPAVIFAQPNGQCQLLALPGTTGVMPVLQFAQASSSSFTVMSTTELPLGEFSHLAGTWDGTALRLYINGILHAEGAPGSTPADSGCPFYIGGFPADAAGACGATGQSFQGIIDEVSYYSRALSDAEVQSICSAGTMGKCRVTAPPAILSQPSDQTVYAGAIATFNTAVAGDSPLGCQWQLNGTNLLGQTRNSLSMTNVKQSQSGTYTLVVNNPAGSARSSDAVLTVLPPPVCVPPPEGLVSWWRAEGNLTDGWGPNGGAFYPKDSMATITIVAYARGKVGTAFGFGTNCAFVSCSPSLQITNGLTIEGWVCPGDAGSLFAPRTILARFDPPNLTVRTNSSYYLGTSNGWPYFAVSSTGSGRIYTVLVATNSIVPNGEWSHVAATYDGSVMRLYFNGSLAAETAYSGGIFAGTADLGIGAIPLYPYARSWPWLGYLDEICLYNRALSGSEIAAIYGADLTGKCQGPPMILAQPESRTVPLREDVRFMVSAFGSKPMAYQWRFNGQNLAGATGSSLVIEKAQTNNVGSYSVLASNALGRVVSAEATLSLEPPLACIARPTGLISWWPGERSGADFAGTNTVSVSRYYGPSYAPGKVGLAFNIGMSSTNIDLRRFGPVFFVTNSPSLNFGSSVDFSIEAWIKAPPAVPQSPYQPPWLSPPDPTNQLILDKRLLTPPYGLPGVGYALSLCQGRLACWLGAVSGRFTNTAFLAAPGPDLRDGVFHHVALTVARRTGSTGHLYVDGRDVLSFSTTPFSGSLSNAVSLSFGCQYGGSDEDSLDGLLDEVAIYNRVLSPAEVLGIAQAGAAGKSGLPPGSFPSVGLPAPAPGGIALGFTGLPGRSYSLQRAETLTGPWTTLTSLPMDLNGTGVFVDTNGFASNAFYRVRYP